MDGGLSFGAADIPLYLFCEFLSCVDWRAEDGFTIGHRGGEQPREGATHDRKRCLFFPLSPLVPLRSAFSSFPLAFSWRPDPGNKTT